MKFRELDSKMRVFETSTDHKVLPDMHIVVRLDGRGFTKMAKERKFVRPFDPVFVRRMTDTTAHLMKNSGFKILFGYHQSDEVSLLLAPDENFFNRKERKLVSVLAGEASGFFSVAEGIPTCFDARVSQLPNVDRVVDYFRWRQADAVRNGLNIFVYWTLRHEGMTKSQATRLLHGATTSDKNELLYKRNINWNNVDPTYKRGKVHYFTCVDHCGRDPRTGEKKWVKRPRLQSVVSPLDISDMVRALLLRESVDA